MKLRNKWNLYHKQNISYSFFFYNLRPFKARNCFSPFGSQGNYKGLNHQQLHAVLKMDVWNVVSCMFLVFIENCLKKLLMFLNFYHYMQFLGTYSGLYILSQSYVSAWFTILQCIQLLLWKKFSVSLLLFIWLYLLTWGQCLWNVHKRNSDQIICKFVV